MRTFVRDSRRPVASERRAGSASSAGRADEGQIIVLFAIALLTIVGLTGLVIDGGRAFAQRRDEQNVSDQAAMAGAYAYLNAVGDAATKELAAAAAARAVALANGYVENGVTHVAPQVTPVDGGAEVKVDITRPQGNTFARVVGQNEWTVSTTATAVASDRPNAVAGAMPLIFNQKLFQLDDVDGNGTDDDGYSPNIDIAFDEPGSGSEDVPQSANQFNWTVYCTAHGNPCNGNSNTIRQLIDGFGEHRTITLNTDIGPLNSGAHTTLFDALAAHIGKEYPVGIVDDDGRMVGWAWFHLTGSAGGSVKQIRGYFPSPMKVEALVVPDGGTGTPIIGQFVVRLVN